MLIILVLVAFAAGPGLELPGWATALTFALQVVHCLPRARRLRGWWTLAAQAVLFPCAALPGFLSGSVLLIVPGRVRWALFATVFLAAGLISTGDVYEHANAVGNTISQGLVIFALTRLDEVRAELHATRGELAALSVATERARLSRELETTVGSALAEIVRRAGLRDPDGIVALARETAGQVRRDGPERPTPSAATGLTPRMMLPIMLVVHLVYLVVAALFVLRAAPPAPLLAGYLILLVLVVGLQCHHSLPRPPGSRPRLLVLTLPAQVVLACLPMFVPGPPYPQLVGLAAGALLVCLPGRVAWPLATVLLAAVPVTLAARGTGPHEVLASTVDTAVLAVIFYGIAVTVGLVHQVREVRGQLAAIAVARERTRIARDIHDLLGYGISAIALKAELARTTPSPGRSLDEIAGIARRSLADLRAIPGDSTVISLDEELRSAREVLLDAGMTPCLDVRHGAVPPRVDELLATVLREAVTNVLRHGRAGVCVIESDRQGDTVRLRVANNVGTPPPERRGAGSGIGNLAARMSAEGGELTVDTDGDRFELTVYQPLDAP
ncbi:hypothetical protein CFN78_20975 [Amycolatopsis antarctica]|uniref:Signal transduction histidine kinase subgroup 3 dimerisation and phosphoacceptor domain-containing protein n=1 Tax=Amycolatopsis antarctica TaxID=1854586 RepID=A0A263CYN6_9PSEU|nr:histidine kinase [Amycolatopsis antarctica]OZM71272.1 hypothetical protein CFN78_20975 [Amycolatopsis antarctica]